MGRILDTLRELKLAEKTLVVFTSDNGPWSGPVGEATSAGPLRGSKGSTWEGGVRVPTIAWWPGHVPPGSTCDAVTGTIDLLPTFVNLSAAHPDVVRQLRTLIQATAADLATNARRAGTVADPQMLYPAVSPERSPKRSRKRESSPATPSASPSG